MRVRFRPTVGEDLQHVIAQPLPFRIRAITAVDGDRVLGVGGLGYMPDGLVVAFVAMNEDGRQYPRAIHRAGLEAMEMIRSSGERRVVAVADERVPGAARWLQRLGFEAVTVDGVTGYVWQAR